jgi:serine/threonine-protein kinase
MPYQAGETLDWLLRQSRLRRETVLSLSIAIAEAVLAILSRGYIHRDLKPENLFCTRDGAVQILDFGLARRCSDSPLSGELSGTLAYASPEQIEGEPLDAKSDLFSLGVVLYELATGEMFFPRETTRLSAFLAARRRRMREHVQLPGVAPSLAALIRRLLVESAAQRAGPSEVAARVEQLKRHQVTSCLN